MIVQEYHIIYCITFKIFTCIDLEKIFKVHCLTLRYLLLKYCCRNLLEIHLLNVRSNPIVTFGYIYYDMVDFAGQNKIKSKLKEASLMGIHYNFFLFNINFTCLMTKCTHNASAMLYYKSYAVYLYDKNNIQLFIIL